jgi:hypothetical protein
MIINEDEIYAYQESKESIWWKVLALIVTAVIAGLVGCAMIAQGLI